MRLAVAAWLVFSAVTAQAAELTGRVTGLTDGDTITILAPGNVEEKVRLAGIDAPERGMAFSDVAKESLSDMTFGKTVNVAWHKRDRYGRLVGKVMVEGLDANLEQVKKGLAWHYKEYQGEQSPADRGAYSKAESAARTARNGLWADPDPIPPWNYRKLKRAPIQVRSE